MAYRRKRTYKRSMRKRTGSSRWSTYSRAGSQLWKDVKYLKSLVNVEFKRFDTDTGYQIPGVVGGVSLQHLTNIAQGDTTNTRDGNSIKLQSILMRFNFYRALNAGPGTPRQMTRFRVMLIHSKYNNNALPAVTDVLQSATFHSPLNADESRGYRILHDKFYQVTADKPSIQTKWYMKLYGHTKWSGTTANITDATSGHLFYLVFVDDATNGDAVTMNSRIRFTDN